MSARDKMKNATNIGQKYALKKSEFFLLILQLAKNLLVYDDLSV
jgi:hypothetical protein